MLVSIGSKNKTKVEAVKEALNIVRIDAKVIDVEVESGVPNQPLCKETLIGARNRAIKSLKITNSDIGIGIEGGICIEEYKMLAFAVVYVVDKYGNENFSKSASFVLPKNVVKRISNGIELGYAVDMEYSRHDSKHSEGAVGILTKYIDRKKLYVEPVILALYPFYNKEINFE
ncbi:DUF84 family protein [Acidianus sulfidivorans JP7]|uniref:Probable inosine/xanthosine triphosphatase n=1 Tax=Acidianus sulfidivorans JP7 TaxID=619593 RepID=A0A2U9IKH1_9CREN|nr:inosine/xanthosine triphosphatase [Acidianus sulfidivorans]AWR96539.1 DUF84 family protein [Acidianus sulfidivorans JP7]